jgi:hypothetical protein
LKPTFSLPALAAVALAALFLPHPTRAATALSDAELSQVRGGDGSIALIEPPAPPPGGEALGATLSAVFTDPRGLSVLDAAGFAAALADAGLNSALVPGYDGQAVKQYRIAMQPVTFSFGASELLLAGTGLSMHGPSMGAFTMTDFDATGTTVWSWVHR